MQDMLRVFYGSDRKAAVDAVLAAADGEAVTIDANSFVEGQFDELTAGASLFGETQIYVIDTPSSSTDFKDATTDALAAMAESANQFLVVESTLLAAAKKKYAKYAETIEEFTADKPERFNTFAMADALAKRDKKTLWVLLQEAKLVGIREEEVIGILWWQLKSLRLAATTNSAAEAGMKDYPYRKAKQSLAKFKDDEVVRLSNSLLSVYHRGHKGLIDLEFGLESWVLKV